jgi:hypothetical protein
LDAIAFFLCLRNFLPRARFGNSSFARLRMTERQVR